MIEASLNISSTDMISLAFCGAGVLAAAFLAASLASSLSSYLGTHFRRLYRVRYGCYQLGLIHVVVVWDLLLLGQLLELCHVHFLKCSGLCLLLSVAALCALPLHPPRRILVFAGSLGEKVTPKLAIVFS